MKAEKLSPSCDTQTSNVNVSGCSTADVNMGSQDTPLLMPTAHKKSLKAWIEREMELPRISSGLMI